MWGEVSLLEQEAHLAKDYPHQCGEKYKNPKFDYYGFGLPPPVWGEDEETIKIVVEKRITPTSVGRSPYSTKTALITQGLPPPVWGEA